MVIKCIALEKNKKCKGGKLNANSSEFLSIVLDITIDEAKTYLRNRNSSPFYKEIFNTKEEYKKVKLEIFNILLIYMVKL
jgi:hypothetical protein